MFGALVGGIGSALGGKLGSSMFGGDKPGAPGTAGIDSAAQGSEAKSAPPDNVTTSGSQNDDLIQTEASDSLAGFFRDIGDQVTTAGVSSAIGKLFAPSAKKQGKSQREYMDALFPELNPWEQAGSAAAGGDVGSQHQAERLQDKQLKNQREMNRENLANQKDIAKIQANNQVKVAGINSAANIESSHIGAWASNQRVDSEIGRNEAQQAQLQASAALLKENRGLVKANIDKVVADTGKTNEEKALVILKQTAEVANIDLTRMTTEQREAATRQIEESLRLSATAKTYPFKVLDDTVGVLQKVERNMIDMANKGWDKAKKFTSGVRGAMGYD